MTDLIFANPTLIAIALVGILFAFGDAMTRETQLRVVPVKRRRRAE